MLEYTNVSTVEAVQWIGAATLEVSSQSLQDFRDWGIKVIPTKSYFKDDSIAIIDQNGEVNEIEKNDWIVKLNTGKFRRVRPARFASNYTAV